VSQRWRVVKLIRVDFTETELKKLEDPKRTPAWGWFVSLRYKERSRLIWNRKLVNWIHLLIYVLSRRIRRTKDYVSDTFIIPVPS